MSLGLLGAYDSSSEEEEEVVVVKKPILPQKPLTNPFAKKSSNLRPVAQGSSLPKPSFMVKSQDYTSADQQQQQQKKPGDHSVFSNPFRAKEEQKRAVLEKHVSMTVRQEDLRKIEGKKICWNFRKGRCRFGHKCTFAHDSDVNVAVKTRENAVARAEENEGAVIDTKGDAPRVNVQDGTARIRPGAKRPGLSESLVPGKKAMKFHSKVYNKE